jgi:hypothetical protein
MGSGTNSLDYNNNEAIFWRLKMGYIEDLREIVGNRPLILVGAMVCVIDERGKILLQKRPEGIWGLPGGLLELGESVEEAGRREVFEETGIEIGQLLLVEIFSGKQYFRKLQNGDKVNFHKMEAVSMNVLSMIQPLASLFVLKEAKFETRSWRTKYRVPYCSRRA